MSTRSQENKIPAVEEVGEGGGFRGRWLRSGRALAPRLQGTGIESGDG